MTRRQLLSDRIHELNKGLENENSQNNDGEEVVVGEKQDEEHHYRQDTSHNPRNRNLFHEDCNRFTQMIKRNHGTGYLDAPPSKSLSDDDDWQPEGDDYDDDFYFDDDYDADERTTLRKPASATGHVKKIVNR